MKIQVVYSSRAEAYRMRMLKRKAHVFFRDGLKAVLTALISVAVLAFILTGAAADNMELMDVTKILFGSLITAAVSGGIYKIIYGGDSHDVQD